MPNHIKSGEIEHRLNAAFEADKLPQAGGGEFFAEVRVKAMSIFVFRLAVVVGILVVVLTGFVGYVVVTVPREPAGIQTPDDPGGGSARTRLPE